MLDCKKSACAFLDILAAAGLRSGDYQPPGPAELARREAERQAEAAKKARQTERCWRQARPIEGTPAERYLRARGIACPLPPTLRFHPEAWHGPTASRHPALVALVEGCDGFAVHRTYLRPDGTGKAALDPAKLMLGATPGGAVRLSDGPRPARCWCGLPMQSRPRRAPVATLRTSPDKRRNARNRRHASQGC